MTGKLIMRTVFHRQLEALRAELGRMCGLAADSARYATDALLEADVDAAAQALVAVERLSALHRDVERAAVDLLARQAPVARDLRTVVSAIRVAADSDRMGGLAAHVVKLCRLRTPDAVVPAELEERFYAMGELAVSLGVCCQELVLTGDPELARRISAGDEAMEVLHQALFRLVDRPSWPYGSVVAADVVLLGRFYGRYADHADEIAKRVGYQLTGDHAPVSQ